MQKTSVKNIVQFIIKHPNRIPVLLKKIFLRFKEQGGEKTDLAWIHQHQVDFKEWAVEINERLWNESEEFSARLKEEAAVKIKSLPISMGGGGIYPVLYFITRHYQPSLILETGVAAGYSSQTFLSAIQKNGKGILYSSDFPYFRIPDPEKYIGILVDEKLKINWKLYLEGDEKNLPLILSEIQTVDLFHYDSDKSYKGREFAWNLVKQKLHSKSLIVFDDIQDNNYFKHFVSGQTCTFHVFYFQGKYAGLVYDFK